MNRFTNLEPKHVWHYFDTLLDIPRPSKHEDRVIMFLRELAQKKGLEFKQDRARNVVIKVPATKGYEHAPTVILQGHLDMVAEKNSDVDFDFLKQPIDAYIDGDWVKARGTTLGADNGIGVAAALALIDDSEAIHGPLEILCTVDEETGLTGASNLDPRILSGKIMLNLDSEEDGVFFIGCAGGANTIITLPVKQIAVTKKFKFYEVKISGLLGGHSGLNIIENRANAIKLMARILKSALNSKLELMIVDIKGGDKHNAIPRECFATVAVNEKHTKKFLEAINNEFEKSRVEFGNIDKEMKLDTKELSKRILKAMNLSDTRKVINLILALPHGVISMSREIKGLVETSSNLATVKMRGRNVEILTSSRSSVSEALDAVLESINSLVELCGGKTKGYGRYPGWRPNIDSPLLKKAVSVFKNLRGNDPKITAIHAGLECGIIMEKIPGIDVISFGPEMHGVHSPQERLSISSVGRFYSYLKALLESIAKEGI
ncbi:MAG: aminoacyl-histidine dipeptidase [Deltaproteobacteria bacterium]|nr:aminoacyl-histidine dipeptidase [Deltaproteobacteria bacterium]